MAEPRTFGSYQLIKRIASGGMAEIFLAKTKGIAGFEKLLALKMIRENFSTDAEFIEMLVNEAKIAVRLTHSNVVQVFDLGQIDGRYYIAMEYIDGCDLHALIAETERQGVYIPFEAVAYIIREACSGLHYAHERLDENGNPLNIVHRDISPQNILLGLGGEVKIVDFGIAKANIDRSETQIGILKGKFCYMSPEQAWGDVLDRRSDVFSLGSVLYEVLTGHLMYHEDDQMKLLDMVRRAQIPPPTVSRREIPSELEAISMQAVERDRKERFSSAAELYHELNNYLAKYAPSYNQASFAEYLRAIFPEAGMEQEIRRSEAQTRNALVPRDAPFAMERDEYVPEDSSLVHSFHHLQAMARSSARKHQRPVAEDEPEDATVPIRMDIAQRQALLAALEERKAAERLPPPGVGFDDEEPTQAYTRDEINSALLSGGHEPIQELEPWSRSAGHSLDNAASAPGQHKPQARGSWHEARVSDDIPLQSDDLMPVNAQSVMHNAGGVDTAPRRAHAGSGQHPSASPASAAKGAKGSKGSKGSIPAAQGSVRHAPRVLVAPQARAQHTSSPGLRRAEVPHVETLKTTPHISAMRGPAPEPEGPMTMLWFAVGAILLLGIVAAVLVVFIG